MSLIPINLEIFCLFNSFVPHLAKYFEPDYLDLYARCVSYFVKNLSDFDELIQSSLLESFLLLSESYCVVECLVDLIHYCISKNHLTLLNYYIRVGLLATLFEVLHFHAISRFSSHEINEMCCRIILAIQELQRSLEISNMPHTYSNLFKEIYYVNGANQETHGTI